MTNNGTAATSGPVPAGTRVINVRDGQDGSVLGAYDTTGAEYEVETAYGIEVWKRADFVTFAEAGVATRSTP